MQLFTVATLALLGSAFAADLTLYLPARPNPFTLPPTTRATLTRLGVQDSALISSTNTFIFKNLTAGSYLADVHCQTDGFQPLRIDIAHDGSVKAWETYRGNDWDNTGESVSLKEGSGGRGLELRALGAKNYFMERPQFSVLTILKNPMILMGLVSMLLFFGMPYLMDNMDPELRAEFEEHQKKSPMNAVMGSAQSGENPLGNFDMAAFLAGSGKKDAAVGSNSQGTEGSQGVRR